MAKDSSWIVLLTMLLSSSNGCAMAHECEFVLCQGDFEGLGENTSAMGHLLQHFNGWNGMPILNAGNVAAKQAAALFDVSLGEFLFFAECAKAVAYNHTG